MKKIMVAVLMVFMATVVSAKESKHRKVSESQECTECHVSEGQLWESGKHGLMNVKCVVCHGSTDRNFDPKPDIYKCRGCHWEKVRDVETKIPQAARKCSLCHTLHSIKSKFHN